MFMPDTDICSYFLKKKSEAISSKFDQEGSNILLSEIVLAELRYGADRHQQKSLEIHQLIDSLVGKLKVVGWEASSEYGVVRSQLERAGTPIGNNDTLIAAHALNLGVTLITNNVKHYKRVPELKFENWS